MKHLETSLRTVMKAVISGAAGGLLLVNGLSGQEPEVSGEVYDLEALEVTPLEDERNRSIAAKETANAIGDFISADRLGQFVDDDIGSIVERMPGVYTSGAGQSGGDGISVRGLRGDFNSLQLNSNRLPSNQGQTRGVSIDNIPAELIGEIEVFKAVTPDREADSIGGLVNIITKSGLDYAEPFISGNAAYGIYELDTTAQYQASLNYAGRLSEDTGLFFGISYRKEDEKQRDEYDFDPGDYVWEQFYTEDIGSEIEEDTAQSAFSYGRTTILRTLQSQENLGLTLNLDHRVSEDLLISFRSYFAEFTEERPQWRARYRYDRSDDDDPIGEEFGDSDFVLLEDGIFYYGDDQRIRKRLAVQDETETIQSYAVSFVRQYAEGELDGGIALSTAKRDLISDQFLWEADDIPMRVDLRDIENAEFALLMPGDRNFEEDFKESDLFDPAYFDDDGDGYFEVDERRAEFIDSEDRILAANINYKRYLDPEKGTAFIKAGAKFRGQSKESNRDFVIVPDFEWDGAAASYQTITDWYDDGRVDMGIYPTYGSVREQNTLSPEDLILLGLTVDPRADDVAGSVAQDFEVDEDVTALYFLGSYSADRWTVLAGVRYEHTDNSFKGFNVDEPLGILPDFNNPRYNLDGGRSYDGFYPSIHVNYQAGDNLLVRASIGQTLARPAFQDLFPSTFTVFTDENDEGQRDINIRRGNTELDPTESLNVDLSIEYYIPSGGIFSAAFFYKDISDYIIQDTAILSPSEFPEYAGIENIGTVFVESSYNGDGAEVSGFEFNWEQPVGGGFSILANYTIIDISVNENETGLDRIPGQAEELMNLGLAYENKRLTARLTYRYASEILDETVTFGNSAASGLFGGQTVGAFSGEESTLDLSVDYRLSSGWTLFARWRNITGDEPGEYINNDTNYPIELEREGYDILAGVKFRF